MSKPLVLVSGVSGYVGAHVVKALLGTGQFRVRGTVRSEGKAQEVRAYLGNPANLEFAIVRDIGAPNAFDDCIEGSDFVVHTASPFTYAIKDPQTDLIDPATNGTRNILNAVVQFGPSVKRVVVTSSVAAIRTPTPALKDGLSELDWNLGAVAQFEQLKSATPAAIAYPASKTLAEKAAWDYVKQESRHFDLVTINPPFIFGPPIHPISSPDDVNTSVKIIADFYSGRTKEINPAIAAGFVDVRDVAHAHVLALTCYPKASNERFLVSSGPFTHELLVNVLKKRFPDYSFATGVTTAVPVREINTKSKGVLGMGDYIDLETSVVDTVNELVKRFGNRV